MKNEKNVKKIILIIIIIVIITTLCIIKLYNNKEKKLYNNEVLSILKTKFDYTEKYLTTFQNPCGENAEIEFNIDPKNQMPYYLSKTYSNYNEIENEILENMTYKIMRMKTSFIKDNYLEKDGKLYCQILNGGQITNYDPSRTEYNIENINDDIITASVISYQTADPDGNISSRTINIKLIKQKKEWKISEYQPE